MFIFVINLNDHLTHFKIEFIDEIYGDALLIIEIISTIRLSLKLDPIERSNGEEPGPIFILSDITI